MGGTGTSAHAVMECKTTSNLYNCQYSYAVDMLRYSTTIFCMYFYFIQLSGSVNQDSDSIFTHMTKSTNFTIRKVNTTGNEPSFQVKGLRPYTVYSFQIIAWNAIGPSNPSKPSYFMVTLRELPEARIPFTARNMSSTSVFISWEPPDIDLINGDFLGYRLTWKQIDGPNVTQEKYIRNASVTKHIIGNLLPHTEYHIGLSVFNPEGYGPNTTLLITTDEGGQF